MRALLLDYGGTLDPWAMEPGQAMAFVKALIDQGDYVVLWTATNSMNIRAEVPGLAEAVDSFRSKCTPCHEFFEDWTDNEIPVTEVVILDDDPNLAKATIDVFNIGKPGFARYVHSKDWRTLLKGGA